MYVLLSRRGEFGKKLTLITWAGDMKRPACSLCVRTGHSCVFPSLGQQSMQSVPRQRKPRADSRGKRLGTHAYVLYLPGSCSNYIVLLIDRLLHLLESESSRNLTIGTISTNHLPSFLSPNTPPSLLDNIHSTPAASFNFSPQSMLMAMDRSTVQPDTHQTDVRTWPSTASSEVRPNMCEYVPQGEPQIHGQQQPYYGSELLDLGDGEPPLDPPSLGDLTWDSERTLESIHLTAGIDPPSASSFGCSSVHEQDFMPIPAALADHL